MTPTRLARDVSTVRGRDCCLSSWSHMAAVALRFGEHPEVACVLPRSVDGMLVVASAARVEDKRAGRRVRWSARTAFAARAVASVAANIAATPSLGARIVAAWPAAALRHSSHSAWPATLHRAQRPDPAAHHRRLRP
nr:DUF2637 domain-containing protein [Salinispora cortesiana]